MWQSWVAFIIGLFAFIGAVIFFVATNKKVQKIDVLPNADLVINICKTKFTQGYQIGIMARNGKRENKNGTYLIKYFPIDVDQGKDMPKPDIQSFVILKENLVLLSSGRRKIWLVSSENADDYPDNVRETIIGKFATAEGMKAYLRKTFGDAFREMSKVVADLQVEWSGGEVTAHGLEKIKETNKKVQELNSLVENVNKKLGEPTI